MSNIKTLQGKQKKQERKKNRRGRRLYVCVNINLSLRPSVGEYNRRGVESMPAQKRSQEGLYEEDAELQRNNHDEEEEEKDDEDVEQGLLRVYIYDLIYI